MKNKGLKIVRVSLAVLFFTLLLFYFLDFRCVLPSEVQTLARWQLLPALLYVSAGTAAFLLLFTLLFGRLYCSVLCPAGVLQDLFIRLRGKKRSKKKAFSYHRPSNWLRYLVLGLSVLLLIAGSNQVLSFLDPYSNFGRIASQLFYPVLILGNNLIAGVLAKTGNYTLYYISVGHVVLSSLLVAASVFLLLFVLSVLRGRLFCNTLCPVGALLSLFSRYSFFRIVFDKTRCNECGLCERSCKSECIDSKAGQVDASRCVDCFNCIPSCKKGGLKYTFSPVWRRRKAPVDNHSASSDSRRSFIATGFGLLGTIPLLSSCKKSNPLKEKALPVTPPGAISQSRFETKCTACHLCVLKCPSKILKPAGMQYGFAYMLKPYMNYEKAYCNYECTVCTEVCPNDALKTLSAAEKTTVQIGAVHLDLNRCVVLTDGKDCGACSEHCPTQAVKMVPYTDDLRIPQIDPSICVGCGGCECICPVRPARAITVVANREHIRVEKPEYEKVEEVEVTGFGF